MEFSFDRSKETHLRKPENSVANNNPPEAHTSINQAQPQSAGPRPGPDLNTVDPATVANERLRKAIERNRAKQMERDTQRPPAPPPPPPFQQAAAPREEAPRDYHHQASFLGASRAESVPVEKVETPRVEVRETVREASAERATSSMPRSSTVVSRRSVAKPDDTEFVPVKRAPRKVASQISYTTGSARKKSKSLDPKYVNWLVKGCWIFCGIMVLRLIFAAGGVTDYYSQKATVNERLAELVSIKKENMQLVHEIERMRADAGFQKKLVRDNLGFIASDEFLILFPKEK